MHTQRQYTRVELQRVHTSVTARRKQRKQSRLPEPSPWQQTDDHGRLGNGFTWTGNIFSVFAWPHAFVREIKKTFLPGSYLTHVAFMKVVVYTYFSKHYKEGKEFQACKTGRFCKLLRDNMFTKRRSLEQGTTHG
jgi:hypothetical protein